MIALLTAGTPATGLLIWGTLGNVLGALFNYGIGSLGKEEWIIVDGISKKSAKMLVAKTDANKPVVFEKYEGWKMGDYIKIRIVETHTWYLVGEKIS